MAEYWQPIHTRGQQTVAVWQTFNEDFMVETVTLDQHKADVVGIMTASAELSTQQDVLDDAVTARKNNLKFIHRMIVRAPKLIRSNLPDGDSLLPEVDDVYDVPLSGEHNKMDRARLVISLWTRTNAKRAAKTPPLPPILVLTTPVAELSAALEAHPALMQAVIDQKAVRSAKKTALRVVARRVDKVNKRWYSAWSAFYDEGSPEHDALDIIETEQGTVPPTAVQIQGLVQSQSHVSVTYVAGGGAHATTIELLWQIAGVDQDFVHAAQLIFDGQQVGPFAAGQTINFKTRAANSQAIVHSTVQSITMASLSLPQPTGLQLQEGPMNTINATWNAVAGANHYVVEHQRVGTDTEFIQVGTTTNPSFMLGGYSGGTTVRVRVKAVGNTGPAGTPISPYSAVAEIAFA